MPLTAGCAVDKDALNARYPPLPAENAGLSTRHADPFCQVDASLRDADALLGTLGNLRRLHQSFDAAVRSSSVNEIVAAAPLVRRTTQTPDLSLACSTRALVFTPAQAAEYLARPQTLRPGAFPPALVEDDASASSGVLQHTGWARDKLQFCIKHDLVLVYENAYGDGSAFVSDETMVVMDARSGGAHAHLDAIRFHARRRVGTVFASPASRQMLANPQPWRATPTQRAAATRHVRLATAAMAATAGASSQDAPASLAIAFNKHGSLRAIHALATKLVDNLANANAPQSAEASVAATLVATNRPGRPAVDATYRVIAGTARDCRNRLAKLDPRKPEPVDATSSYAAVLDAFGPLYSKRGACLFSHLLSWASPHAPHIDAVLWTVELKVGDEDKLFAAVVHTGSAYAPRTIALAAGLRLGWAVERMTLTSFTADGKGKLLPAPSGDSGGDRSVRAREKAELFELGEVEGWFARQLASLPVRPKQWATTPLPDLVQELADFVGLDSKADLARLWQLGRSRLSKRMAQQHKAAYSRDAHDEQTARKRLLQDDADSRVQTSGQAPAKRSRRSRLADL